MNVDIFYKRLNNNLCIMNDVNAVEEQVTKTRNKLTLGREILDG
jgi:hypothetical protein